jgi:predicted DNA-binding protein
MQTKKKRLGLSLPEGADEVLTALSESMGVTKSAIVVDLIEGAMPTLRQFLVASEEAKQGKKRAALNVMVVMLKEAGFQVEVDQHDTFDTKNAHQKRYARR